MLFFGKREREKRWGERETKREKRNKKKTNKKTRKNSEKKTRKKHEKKKVRAIHKEGLLWGASKLVPIGYGIKKMQITAVIEDAKVESMDAIIEGERGREKNGENVFFFFTFSRCRPRQGGKKLTSCFLLFFFFFFFFFFSLKNKKQQTEELVRDGESDNIQSIDVVSFNKL